MILDIPSFDGACVGRPATHVLSSIAKYYELEQELPQRDLNRFHIDGYVEDLHAKGDSHRAVLRSWRGFMQLERNIVRLVGPEENSHWLIDYGKSTSDILDLILRAVARTRILLTDDLYKPWRDRILTPRVRESCEVHVIRVRHFFREDQPRALAKYIARSIVGRAPEVVLLSVVTQQGYRIPVEEIVTFVADGWSKRLGWTPLFVLDGCQAYGRVPFRLDDTAFGEYKCAYIGCMHKALRGPKESAFLICNSGAWRPRIQWASQDRCRDIFRYARSLGRDPQLPTISCASAIGTAASLYGVTAQSIYDCCVGTLKANQYDLVRGLKGSAWEVATPPNGQWASGIVLLRPPRWLRMKSKHAIKELLAPIVVDEMEDEGCIRIAFDGTHSPDEGKRLAKTLRDIADSLK